MIVVLIAAFLFVGIFLFLKHPLFGKHPAGERRERISRSSNFKDNQAQNILETPQLTEGFTMSKVLYDFIFGKKLNVKPLSKIKTVAIDFKNIDVTKDAYYWFGHSSYLLVLSGEFFLIDPVLTKNASPVFNSNKAFDGTLFFDISDLPNIDYLIITHDHYDHLDYSTIKTIKNKVSQVICGLGVGSHFEHWGYNPKMITELDWWETKDEASGIKITATPVRHFSGRTFFHKNNTLFCSFVIETKNKRIFIGGDSGYGPHFKDIGERFAPFDIVFIENGQYNRAWHYIHLHPDEFPLVLEDLKASVVVPVHHSKFALSHHPWKEPLEMAIRQRSNRYNIHTPMIGERVDIVEERKDWPNWWENS